METIMGQCAFCRASGDLKSVTIESLGSIESVIPEASPKPGGPGAAYTVDVCETCRSQFFSMLADWRRWCIGRREAPKDSKGRDYYKEPTEPVEVVGPDSQVWTATELRAVMNQCAMSSLGTTNWNWTFEFRPTSDGERTGWFVWVTFDRIDYATGRPGRGRGRDMILWEGTQKSGVVKTLWVLVEQVVRHELFHAFRYKGRELFDPHAPVDLLYGISGKATQDAYNHFRPIKETPHAP
jgi:hypothetical protein